MPRSQNSDARTLAFLRSLAEAESADAVPADTQKSVQDFARLAVPSLPPGAKPEAAPWVVDRNEYVNHFRGITFVAVGAIAKKVAQQEAVVYRRTVDKAGEHYEPLYNHPLAELFYEVNPIHTQFDLWYQMVCWRLITGDSFWWKARNGFKVPAELWPLPSQWVWAIPSREKFIAEYVVKGVFGKDTRMPAEDVLHIREPSIDWLGGGRYYGTPNLKAAAKAVDLEEQMFNRLFHQFKNYAPPGLHYHTDKELTQAQWYDILSQIRLQHKEVESSGAPIVSHSGMKASEWRQTVRELDYSNSLMTVMDYTLSIFGVPKAVVGLSKDFNRANSIGALITFIENTVNPLLVHLGQHLTQGLAADFGDDLVVRFTPCTVNDRDSLRKDIELCHRANAITPNEVRDTLIDKPEFAVGGDRPLVQTSLTEAPFGNSEEPIEPPAPPPPPPAAAGKPDGDDEQTPPAAGDSEPGDDPDKVADADQKDTAKLAAEEVVARFFRSRRRSAPVGIPEDPSRNVAPDPQAAGG